MCGVAHNSLTVFYQHSINRNGEKEMKIIKMLKTIYKHTNTKNIVNLTCIVFGISAILDFILWFIIGYEIPCWTIGVSSLMDIVFIKVIQRLYK